ncbi:MAG: pyruvate kinase [bacterium]
MTADGSPKPWLPRQTKIVATVGPASEGPSMIEQLIRRGVDVFRINTAHGNLDEHAKRINDIRRVSDSIRPVAVLVDLAGPKIRLGEIPGGQLNCEAGTTVRFVRGSESSEPTDLVTTYDSLIDELEPGSRVMLADGTVVLDVTEVDDDSASCTVVQPGVVRSSQGVNLPGLNLSAPTMGKEDKDNAGWAVRMGADFIGLSFVRSAADVRELKSLIGTERSRVHVIAKIEKPEALDDLEARTSPTPFSTGPMRACSRARPLSASTRARRST